MTDRVKVMLSKFGGVAVVEVVTAATSRIFRFLESHCTGNDPEAVEAASVDAPYVVVDLSVGNCAVYQNASNNRASKGNMYENHGMGILTGLVTIICFRKETAREVSFIKNWVDNWVAIWGKQLR